MRAGQLPARRVSDQLNKFTRTLDYAFGQEELAEVALTHRSAGEPHNERLEFLGDALLGAIVATELYYRFPAADEGQLTRMRASLVNKDSLATLAREIGIGHYIRLGEGERKSGGWHRDSILANVLEAIIGAIYLDGGATACESFVTRLMAGRITDLTSTHMRKDPKTELQELLQSRHMDLPTYHVVAAAGEPHARTFTVTCVCPGLSGDAVTASGSSRRKAEQKAAELALQRMLGAFGAR